MRDGYSIIAKKTLNVRRPVQSASLSATPRLRSRGGVGNEARQAMITRGYTTARAAALLTGILLLAATTADARVTTDYRRAWVPSLQYYGYYGYAPPTQYEPYISPYPAYDYPPYGIYEQQYKSSSPHR